MIIRNLEDSVSNYLGFFMPIMPPQARLHASGESQDKDGEAGGGGGDRLGRGAQCLTPLEDSTLWSCQWGCQNVKLPPKP